MEVEQAVKGKSKKKIAGIVIGCIIAAVVIVVIAARPPETVRPEPAIPAHFTTYTDESELFTISYPPEWEIDLEYMQELDHFSKEIIAAITSDIPLEEGRFVFLAAPPLEAVNVNIVVEPIPAIMWTHDRVVTAAIESLKLVASDYHELSRVKTTVDNRPATIIECQATLPVLGAFHYVFMICIVNNTAWTVTCTALPDEHRYWESDFDAIVRSLRILK
ncbi:MAG: PsbP-related protein [Dehalococcoidia bacterium]